MSERRCDVAVIGAGTAGLAAREAAAAAGADVVLIERGPGGTTCARVGCMPSKLLIAAGAAMHGVAEAGRFGIRAGDPRADGPAVMARLRRHRDRFVEAVRRDVAALPAGCLIAGRARFLGPTTLQVEGAQGATRIEARSVVIATGAAPEVPEVLGPVRDRVLTNETVFELADLPASVAVLGAGPVGLELAQALTRLGVRTVLIDPGDRIGGLGDPEVARAARAALAAAIDLRLGVEVRRAVPDGAGARLTLAGADGATREETFERVLAAAGRSPALDALDLGRAGIALDAYGTPVFDPASRRCGTSPIFVAGDAGHERPVLHEARRSGQIAGANAARYPRVEAPARWAALSIVYSRPEIAVAGAGFDGEALARGDWRVGCADFSDQGRAVAEGEAAGLLRVYAEPGGRLVGAEMACPGAEHLGHLLAWAVQEGWSAETMLDRPFYHPTLEEGLRTALQDLAG